jgi:hypothetical protein
MKAIVLSCAVVAAGSTLTLDAQQGGRGGPAIPGFEDFFISAPTRPVEAQVVKGMPYSAEIVSESIQTLGDGNRIVKRSTGRVYRDAEGRTRREDDRPSGMPMITITDPIGKTSFTLDPESRTARETPAMQFYLRGELDGPTRRLRVDGTLTEFVVKPVPSATGGTVDARAGRMIGSQDPQSAGGGGRGGRGAAGGVVGAAGRGGGGQGGGRGAIGRRDQAVEEQLPNRTIDGVICSGVRRTTTIPQGSIGNDLAIKIVSEEWTSVDLQVLVKTDFNDPRTGRSTYDLSRISRREPDPSLFKVPADYTIQKIGGRGRGGKR